MKLLLFAILFIGCASTTIVVPCRSEVELQKCVNEQLKKDVIITNVSKKDKGLYEVTYEEK